MAILKFSKPTPKWGQDLPGREHLSERLEAWLPALPTVPHLGPDTMGPGIPCLL